MSWSAGYVTELDYTYGYYSELNPHYAGFVLLDAGFATPKWQHACELGFGQGMSVNLHAAAGGVQWHGNDFNPQHAAFARQLAADCGNGAQLSDESFAEFCARDDLPQFDFIGLHGIWSWISPQNQALIVDFVRRKLNVGGVLYISYNTLPGWAAFTPLRQLFVQHAERMSAPGLGVQGQVKAALDFSQQLLAVAPRALADDKLRERLARIASQDAHYLAHEYFNRDWAPMYFADMAAALAPAKLSYACQASTLEQVPVLHFTPEQQAMLEGIADPLFRETVRDYLLNQQFRRDYWVKGPRRLREDEQQANWLQQRLVLAQPRAEVKMKLGLPRGTINLTPALYDPVLDRLADGQPHTVAEIAAHVVKPGCTARQLQEVVRVLVGSRMVLPLPQQAPGDSACCERINRAIIQQAGHTARFGALASAQLGGGIALSRFSQAFLASYLAGVREAALMAANLGASLQRNGERVMHDGKPLPSEEAQRQHLQALAQRFLDHELPLLRGWGVLPQA